MLQSADDLFSVEPLAPQALRDGQLDGRAGARGNDDQSSGFLSRLDVNYRLRQLDDTIDNDAAADNAGDDEEVSEQDDAVSERDRHNSTRSNIDDDGQDHQEVVQEGESDNEFFHEAESESDSDDNQSTQDAQRSVQTGATAGSDTDNSDGSSQPDDDGSDDGETDDHSQEDFALNDEQLERRTTSGSQRNNLAPQSMQWAIRNRDANRSSVRLTSGSGLVFIDPSALRRTTTGSAAVAATQEPPTMSTTASSLARAFGIILRQVCQLFNTVNELYSTGMLHNMNITYQEANELHVSFERNQ